MFIDCREREGKERNMDWGLNSKPRYGSWLRFESTTFLWMGQCSNQLSHPTGALICCFNKNYLRLSTIVIFILQMKPRYRSLSKFTEGSNFT